MIRLAVLAFKAPRSLHRHTSELSSGALIEGAPLPMLPRPCLCCHRLVPCLRPLSPRQALAGRLTS